MPTATPPKDPKTGQFVKVDDDPLKELLDEAPGDTTEKPPEGEGDIKPKPTEEGMAAVSQMVDEAIFGKTDKPKKLPEKKTPEGKTPEKPAPKKPKPAAPPAAPASLTANQIAEAVARGVATAHKPVEKVEKKTDQPVSELTPAQTRKAQVIDRMEKLYPVEYKEASKRYTNNLKKLDDYARQWEKDNPGKEFDHEAEEHAEFFDKNGIFEFWDADHYSEALADLRADEKVSEHKKSTDQRLSDFERRERLRESAPQISDQQQHAAGIYYASLAEAVPDLLGEDGKLNQEALTAAVEQYPALTIVLEDLKFEIAELYKAMNGLEPQIDKEPAKIVSGQPNPRYGQYLAQQELGRFCEQREAALMEKPAEEQLDGEGRSFLPLAKYYALKQDARDKHWTFSVRDLAALRAASMASQVRKIIAAEEQKYRAWAKRRGIEVEENSPASRNNGGSGTPAKGDDDDDKPLSPSTSGQTRMAALKNKGHQQPVSSLDDFASRAIGG